MKKEEQKIQNIIKNWKERGEEWKGTGKDKMFAHPEYYFRLTGEWTGWNKFLGVDKTKKPKAYLKNLEQDLIECIAFSKLMSNDSFQSHLN